MDLNLVSVRKTQRKDVASREIKIDVYRKRQTSD